MYIYFFFSQKYNHALVVSIILLVVYLEIVFFIQFFILELYFVQLNLTLSRYMLTASGKNDIEYLGRNIMGSIIFSAVLERRWYSQFSALLVFGYLATKASLHHESRLLFLVIGHINIYNAFFRSIFNLCNVSYNAHLL